MSTISLTKFLCMKQPSRNCFILLPGFLFFFILSSSVYGQAYDKIDFSADTISRSDANAARLNYLNNIKGGGNPNATEQITLPVDKLKAIMDACASHNISNVYVFMIKIRQADLAHFRKHNPGVSDSDLKGSQMLVFKIPRMAFGEASGSKTKLPGSNPLLLSLAAVGLSVIDYPLGGLPFGSGDVYLSFGGICPPPASCGD